MRYQVSMYEHEDRSLPGVLLGSVWAYKFDEMFVDWLRFVWKVVWYPASYKGPCGQQCPCGDLSNVEHALCVHIHIHRLIWWWCRIWFLIWCIWLPTLWVGIVLRSSCWCVFRIGQASRQLFGQPAWPLKICQRWKPTASGLDPTTQRLIAQQSNNRVVH